MIEKGDGIANLNTNAEIEQFTRNAGFEVVEIDDRTNSGHIPWYQPLKASFSVSGFRHTAIGRSFTSWVLYFAETLHLVPQNTLQVQTTLCDGADALVAGGELGIFTPMLMIIARKPVN